MPFELPPLPYDYAALEPHIDEQTMRLHHDKHHQAYVDNANKALAGTEWEDNSVESVLAALDAMPEEIRTTVRNNAGGHANHTLFWEIMSPDGGGEPEGDLKAAIDDTFGSVDELKALVNDGGVKRFGSGWTWLVYDGTGLALYSTREPGQPGHAERRAAPRHRRLGARLLPQVPEQAPGIPGNLVELRTLGGGSTQIRTGRTSAPAKEHSLAADTATVPLSREVHVDEENCGRNTLRIAPARPRCVGGR